MRQLGFCIFAACVFSSGCAWMNRNKNDAANPPIKDLGRGTPTPDRLVGYLNAQADRLSVIESSDITLTANVQGTRFPSLVGFIACEKPKKFRLYGEVVGTQYLDVGSTDDKFWCWAKDGSSPLFYCSYEDFEKGVKMPLPFQPEWVVQALGMAKYDPAKEYKVQPRQGAYELVENTTVQGMPVRKITVFTAKNVTDPTMPQVTAHIVQDIQTGKTICQATIKRVRHASYRTPEGVDLSVAYPSDVVLEWPAQQMSMTLKIGKAKVNHRLTAEEEARYFTLPSWPGIKSVDMARLPPPGNPTSRNVQQAGGYRQ